MHWIEQSTRHDPCSRFALQAGFISRRKEKERNLGKVATRYSHLLQSVVEVSTIRQGTQAAWAAYTVRTKYRDAVEQYLADHGIASAIYYSMPFHKQSGYQQLPVIDGSCPVSDHACKEIISLLTGSYLSFTAQIRISEAVHKALDPPEEIDQIGFFALWFVASTTEHPPYRISYQNCARSATVSTFRFRFSFESTIASVLSTQQTPSLTAELSDWLSSIEL